MRLNRFLASAGLGSRRSVEELIRTGQVRINGRVVTDLATKVSPDDAVKVGSRLLHIEQTLTAVLNKPRGYVCTAEDEFDRRTIFDLLPKNWPRVFHVGRLDKESEGLLIVTNDGDLSLALTHPRYKIDKEYEVLLDKAFVPTDRAKLLKGFHIIGGRAKMEHLEQLGPNHLRVVLTQGIKRQIRLMLYELGYEVERLVRVRLGVLKIGETRPGDWRILTPKEIATLKNPESAPITRGLGPKPSGKRPERKFPRPEAPDAGFSGKASDAVAPGGKPIRPEAPRSRQEAPRSRPDAIRGGPRGDAREKRGEKSAPGGDLRRKIGKPSGESPQTARKPVGSRRPGGAPTREGGRSASSGGPSRQRSDRPGGRGGDPRGNSASRPVGGEDLRQRIGSPGRPVRKPSRD